LLLRPIAAGARPSYSDPIARDLDGRLHVTVRLPDRDAYACVEPTGAVTLTPLLTRDVLRETDNAAMTGAMNASVYTTAAGLVRIDHYESSNISQERVGHAGRWVSGRRGLWSADWTLGMFGDWFCRVIINNDKPILLGVNLATRKRTRIALPPGDDHVRGAAVDRTDHGDLLRLLHGACELRLHLRAGKTLEVEPTFSVPHTLAGAMHPVPNTGGWLVAADRTLQFIRPDLPPSPCSRSPPHSPATTPRGAPRRPPWSASLPRTAGSPRSTSAPTTARAAAAPSCSPPTRRPQPRHHDPRRRPPHRPHDHPARRQRARPRLHRRPDRRPRRPARPRRRPHPALDPTHLIIHSFN
jgi:hypothetical protein